jgi:hypothetical protein
MIVLDLNTVLFLLFVAIDGKQRYEQKNYLSFGNVADGKMKKMYK